jgi:hypothetical protein
MLGNHKYQSHRSYSAFRPNFVSTDVIVASKVVFVSQPENCDLSLKSGATSVRNVGCIGKDVINQQRHGGSRCHLSQ